MIINFSISNKFKFIFTFNSKGIYVLPGTKTLPTHVTRSILDLYFFCETI